MAGFGGAYLVLSLVGTYYFNITAGSGFIAVALVYFGKWKTPRVFIGSLIFGAVFVLYYSLESVFPSVPYEFFAMWPYLATLLIIILVGSRAKSPNALAKPFTKE
jgi:simple sugar transport system permease protein